MVWRMAGSTGDVILRVQRIDCMRVFVACGMAGQAASVDLFGRSFLEKEELGCVRRISDVRGGGTMTRLAPLMGRTFFRVEGRFPVRGLLPTLVDVFVAGFTRLGAGIVGGFGVSFRIARFGLRILCCIVLGVGETGRV